MSIAVRPPEWNDKDKAKIRKLFDQCDADKGGTVSLDELGRALASDKDLCRILGIDPIAAQPGNKAKLREVFEVVDVDGSDELDFDEFGLFFQSRVEILRYLPGTDDEDKFCIIQESIEGIREHANEVHHLAIPGLFNDKIANITPTVDGLADAILDDIGKFILTLIWAIRMTSCFVYRRRRRSLPRAQQDHQGQTPERLRARDPRCDQG